MRIAIVAPLVTPIREPQLGGSQAILADIAKRLTHRGHDVSVYASSGSSIDGVHVVDTGIVSESLASTLFRASSDEPVGATAATEAFAHLYDMVTRTDCDVVHNHAFDAPAITCAPADVPVVHTLHLPPQRSIADAIKTSPRATIATVSERMRCAWSEHVRVDAVLRNGIPLDEIGFRADASGGALVAGRLSPEKGVLHAIAVAREASVPLTVVGDAYDETYAEEVRALTGDDIELRPALPRTDLWSVMGRATAVMCLVSWDEPFGLVAAEAQACGTPVIATARGALPEIVVDGETGFIVRDRDDAVDALRRIADIDRSRCRAHAERALDLEHTIDAHEALYVGLLR